jgi:hypothetical protein
VSIIVRAINKLRNCAERLMRPHSPQEDATLGHAAERVARDLEQTLLAADQRIVEHWPDQPLAWDTDVAAPGQGHGWIQWKGTSVCMDVHCACGAHGHVDAEFAYFYRCLACDRTFAVGATVRLYECSPEATRKHGERALVDRELGEIVEQT